MLLVRWATYELSSDAHGRIKFLETIGERLKYNELKITFT